jgi:hypothetical protein
MDSAIVTVSGPATDAGIDELLEAAQALHEEWFARKTVTPRAAEDPDAVKLYERLRPHSRSREALELLPAEAQGGLTPEELGMTMRLEKDGSAVSKASARAAIRVIQRVTGGLIDKGVLTGKVVKIDFSRYDVEGAGRYALSGEARKGLDEHLTSA